MKWNKYLPFAIIFFFFNTVGLPLGLTYTTLLAPLFLVWVLLKRKTEILFPFIFLFLPFMIAHLFFVGVDLTTYVITMANLLCIYIFGQAVYTWLKIDNDKEKILRWLLLANTIMCLVAIVFYFTPFRNIFWIQQNVTENVDKLLRLKLFTYEASYYAMIFVPVFIYFFLLYILNKTKVNSGWLLFMLFLPFILSFSIGVIASLVIAGFLCFIIHFRTLHAKRRIVNGYITLGIASVAIAAIVYVFFRDNPFLVRLENIFSGKDTSATGRTNEAFMLAQRILEEKSAYWGVGAGQLKLIGPDIIRGYYLYFYTTPVAIPNAAAETLVLFGWIGFILRIAMEIFFFFLTKTWTNYFRLMLFLFIFIYQFTGSYITNVVEYVIWVMAFTNAFPVFNVARRGPGFYFRSRSEASINSSY